MAGKDRREAAFDGIAVVAMSNAVIDARIDGKTANDNSERSAKDATANRREQVSRGKIWNGSVNGTSGALLTLGWI